MLSAFLTQKQHRIFKMYDVDRSGSLERQDFEALADRLIKIRKLNIAQSKRDEYAVPFRRLWETLAGHAGKGNNDKMSPEEHLAARERMLAKPSSALDNSRSIADVMFGILDYNGDGRISDREYAQFGEAIGLSAADSAEAWKHLDKSGKGTITRDEFLALLHDFAFSEDPAAPGNWLFGKL